MSQSEVPLESGGSALTLLATSRLPPSKANSPRERRRGPRSTASNFRGVSCYKRTGRWEAHIWTSGRQLHLGSFKTSPDAAHAYDRAALRFRGKASELNFAAESYDDDMELQSRMKIPAPDFVSWLRRTGKQDEEGAAAAEPSPAGASPSSPTLQHGMSSAASLLSVVEDRSPLSSPSPPLLTVPTGPLWGELWGGETAFWPAQALDGL